MTAAAACIDLIDRNEIAKLAGVCPATIDSWRKSTGFPVPLKAGPRLLRWRREEVVAWLESRRVAA